MLAVCAFLVGLHIVCTLVYAPENTFSHQSYHVPFFPPVFWKNNNSISNNNVITHNYHVDKKVYMIPSVLRNGALTS